MLSYMPVCTLHLSLASFRLKVVVIRADCRATYASLWQFFQQEPGKLRVQVHAAVNVRILMRTCWMLELSKSFYRLQRAPAISRMTLIQHVHCTYVVFAWNTIRPMNYVPLLNVWITFSLIFSINIKIFA